MITQEKRLMLKTLSVLIDFPDRDLSAFLKGVLHTLEDGMTGIKENLLSFSDYLETHGLLDVREHYTATFDLNPRNSLNLTYHNMGDGESRGRALALLNERYRKGGFEPLPGDLPDYLPRVLEYMALCPEEEAAELAAECGREVGILSKRLTLDKSPYSVLFEAALKVFRTLQDGGESLSQPVAGAGVGR